jgi:hypothetical protein
MSRAERQRKEGNLPWVSMASPGIQDAFDRREIRSMVNSAAATPSPSGVHWGTATKCGRRVVACRTAEHRRATLMLCLPSECDPARFDEAGVRGDVAAEILLGDFAEGPGSTT